MMATGMSSSKSRKAIRLGRLMLYLVVDRMVQTSQRGGRNKMGKFGEGE